ncbi:MarR family winged helix-turn-helix transcriptional regulator [Parvularcula oceani]|uniref:MarR family winged helix-turn-helix transcriptional regulator n=1 Tax=Parvularcula oceani TaxID=1247963 RepID=UPI0009DF7654|nr:MarR family transcriptional regulator [Parvularcula oceani]
MADFALKQSPGHLLRRAQQYADDLYKKEVGSTGPTPRQFTVLHTVSEDEGLSQTDLVRKTGIDRSTLADMIARLTAKGYLARQRTKDDARANAVKLTAAGKKVLKSAEGKVMKAEEEALSMLPKTQQASFMKNLKAYADALDKIEAEQMAPKRAPAAAAPAAKKAPAKKTAKKAPAKKAPAKKAAKKTTAKREAVKATNAAEAQKAPAKKATRKKATAKKTTKAAPRKTAAKRSATKQSMTRKTARKASRRKTSA